MRISLSHAICTLLALSVCGCKSPVFDKSADRFTAPSANTVAEDGAAGPAARRPPRRRDSETLPPRNGSRPQPASSGRSDSAIVQAGATSDSHAEAMQQGYQAETRQDPATAKQIYRRVLQQDPSHVLAHHRLGVIADQEGDYQAAEHHYLTALRRDADNIELLSDLGYSYLLQERFDECRQYLQAALKADPKHSRTLNNLGLLHGRMGEYDLALATFRRAGTEEEAQAKIRTLFPNGPPGATPAPSAIAATREPPLQAPAPGRSGADGIAADAPSDITGRLKQMMEAARQDKSPAADSLNGSNAAPPFPGMPAQEPARFAGPSAPLAPVPGRDAAPGTIDQWDHRSPRNFIPDNHINNAFSQIDREFDRGHTRRSAQPRRSGVMPSMPARMPGNPAATPPVELAATSPRAGGFGETARANSDPLDALELWPPPQNSQPQPAQPSPDELWPPANVQMPRSSDHGVSAANDQFQRAGFEGDPRDQVFQAEHFAGPSSAQPGQNQAMPYRRSAAPTGGRGAGQFGQPMQPGSSSAAMAGTQQPDSAQRAAQLIGMGAGGMFPVLNGNSRTMPRTSPATGQQVRQNSSQPAWPQPPASNIPPRDDAAMRFYAEQMRRDQQIRDMDHRTLAHQEFPGGVQRAPATTQMNPVSPHNQHAQPIRQTGGHYGFAGETTSPQGAVAQHAQFNQPAQQGLGMLPYPQSSPNDSRGNPGSADPYRTNHRPIAPPASQSRYYQPR